jgi:aspartyl-tRNA(Asn)/glutamyl-tRNA(Gln) amidotransferase subunit A
MNRGDPTDTPDTPHTAHGLSEGYRRGTFSPVDVVDEHLDRIKRFEPELNAFVIVDDDGARAEAAASAARWAAGEQRGQLDGVPLTIKDIIAVSGFATGEGSAVGSGELANEDHPVVARTREAGMVILGKTTTSEFGWKGITDSQAHGITRNPIDLDRTPGGSSGGAAASLAAGIGTVAHGSDGGGSIRIPASYCGLVGLKPTFGRVPQHPVDSPFVSLVSNGPLTRSVHDAALFLNVVSQPDPRDWHAAPYDQRDWRVGVDDGVRGVRIGFTTDLGGATTEPEVIAACTAAVEQLESLGAHVETVGPVFDPLRPTFESYWKAGFAARLRSIPEERWPELDPGFLTLAQQGLDVGVANYYAGHAARAQLVRELKAFHSDYDLLITPTMPSTAPPVDTIYHSADFDRWEHAVPFTVPFNLTGQPAASMPVGTDSRGLPVGLQIVGDHWTEALVLRGMRAVEQAVGWSWSPTRMSGRLQKI